MTFPGNVITERIEKQHQPDELLITGTGERMGERSSTQWVTHMPLIEDLGTHPVHFTSYFKTFTRTTPYTGRPKSKYTV